MEESNTSKRATIYFDPAIHKAIRLKALEVERSMSEIVNEAVRRSLVEDMEDLKVFDERAKEPSLDFEQLLKKMKKDGLL